MLWTGFLLGFFGGMHCIGMCGPIALAIPKQEGVFLNVLHKVFYNSGRTVTYGLLGVITGFIGQSFNITGWQQGISIGLGVFLILIIILSGLGSLDVPMVKPVLWITTLLKKAFSRFIKKRSLGSGFLMGIINGFLPCGLVYVALAASIAGGSIKQGVLYMVVFGLGTMPAMLSVSLAGNLLGPNVRRRIYKLVPIFIVALGLLFILRGLNLGIPYISPELSGSHEMPHMDMDMSPNHD